MYVSHGILFAFCSFVSDSPKCRFFSRNSRNCSIHLVTCCRSEDGSLPFHLWSLNINFFTLFHFDVCIVWPLDGSVHTVQDVNHEDFELSFRYQFLAPPVDNLPAELQGPFLQDKKEQVRINNIFR
jgi:hypothetical protein